MVIAPLLAVVKKAMSRLVDLIIARHNKNPNAMPSATSPSITNKRERPYGPL